MSKTSSATINVSLEAWGWLLSFNCILLISTYVWVGQGSQVCRRVTIRVEISSSWGFFHRDLFFASKMLGLNASISRCPIAVKRHCDHSSSYKGQHFMGADLESQRCSPLSWQEHGGMRADVSCCCMCSRVFCVQVPRQQEWRASGPGLGFPSSNTLPLTKPCLLILQKRHSLEASRLVCVTVGAILVHITTS